MKNISLKKKWNTGTVQVQIYPPPIPLIKSKNDEKLDKDFFQIKFCSDPTSEKLDLYELKMALFDNDEPGDLLLFIRNFNMTLKVSGMLKAGADIQYLQTLVRGEALRQFDVLSAEVDSDITEALTYIILGLVTYFLPVNALPKKNRAMRRGMRKLCGIKVRRYAARLVDLNEYLNVFPREKISDKCFVAEVNGYFKHYAQYMEQEGVCKRI